MSFTYRRRSKVAASMPSLSLFCFSGASVGRGFMGGLTAGAPGTGWNPHLPSLSCCWKGQPCPSDPVKAVKPACYHQSFTSLEVNSSTSLQLGFFEVLVPVHVSQVGQVITHRRKITFGVSLPHRTLLLPATHIPARVTRMWDLSVTQDLHEFQPWPPAPYLCCLQGVQTCLFAKSFTFLKEHRAPDRCSTLDLSSLGR